MTSLNLDAHQTICLDFSQASSTLIQSLEALSWTHIRSIKRFLEEWFDESSVVKLQTSGTTGLAKVISKEKIFLKASARLSGDFFGFTTGQTALLALSGDYIAAKMMMVRAAEYQMKLYVCPPTNLSILEAGIRFDFCPLVPLQAKKYLNTLGSIHTLLLGGATLDPDLESLIISKVDRVYHSFASTETLSHIALKHLTKKQRHFEVLPTIDWGKTASHCLWISAKTLGIDYLETNDIIEIQDHGFRWLGRADFIINSGGLKHNPEVLEAKLDKLKALNLSFIISSRPDKRLGNALVLVIERPKKSLTKFKRSDFEALSKVQLPKAVFVVKHLPRTAQSSKIQRLKTEFIFDDLNVVSVYELE
ncbi:MAG: hypothetical protein ACPG4W_02180 [Flavobacteriales bacterium]